MVGPTVSHYRILDRAGSGRPTSALDHPDVCTAPRFRTMNLEA